MATGASTADLAVLLVDARKGVLTQTRRHAYIVSLLGIRHVVLAVNKIDLVGLRPGGLRRASSPSYRVFAADLGFTSDRADPVSARYGDNVTAPLGAHALVRRARRCWSYLETRRRRAGPPPPAVPLPGAVGQPARTRDFRGFAGTIASRHRCAPAIASSSRRPAVETTVARIVTFDGDLAEARGRRRGDADAGRRDRRRPRRRARRAGRSARRSPTSSPPTCCGWPRRRCCPGRPYLMRIGTPRSPVRVTDAQAQGRRRHASSTWPRSTLALNEIGLCNLVHQRADRASIPTRRTATTGALHPDRPLHQRARSAPA